jgi:cytochrome c556
MMTRRLLLVPAFALLCTTPAQVQQTNGYRAPKLEAVAETRLVMEGIARSNFNGLDKHLRQQPADVETWTFVRGQALLVAETANLLMIRPPRNPSETIWMSRAMEMRDAATLLARAAADQDLTRSRAGLQAVAQTCNRCHQTFQVPTRITPFAEPGERRASLAATR